VNVSEPQGGGVFVSYRRQESSAVAGRLAERLAERFGANRVFIDVHTIEPGVDFTEAIAHAVETCEVLLTVIGPSWLTATDEQGRRRLDDPDDVVRLEIEAALTRNVRVIPILVENAEMPKAQDLPKSLAGLARRNAFTVRHESFSSDAERLITSIEDGIRDGGRGQAENAVQLRPSVTDPVAAQERWQLLPLDSMVAGETRFLLSLGKEVHEIKVQISMPTVGRITVDRDQLGITGIIHNKVFIARTLSLNIGSLVTIKVTCVPFRYKVKAIRIQIDKQVLTYET
jgi:hypothetical protein